MWPGAPDPSPATTISPCPFWGTARCGRRASASVTSPKADFGAYSVGWGIEPYPADNRHAASHTEAVPTFSRTFSEGADTGTASSSSALWKATGTCHAWPNPRIAGSSSFTVQVAMPAMFSAFRPNSERYRSATRRSSCGLTPRRQPTPRTKARLETSRCSIPSGSVFSLSQRTAWPHVTSCGFSKKATCPVEAKWRSKTARVPQKAMGLPSSRAALRARTASGLRMRACS